MCLEIGSANSNRSAGTGPEGAAATKKNGEDGKKIRAKWDSQDRDGGAPPTLGRNGGEVRVLARIGLLIIVGVALGTMLLFVLLEILLVPSSLQQVLRF